MSDRALRPAALPTRALLFWAVTFASGCADLTGPSCDEVCARYGRCHRADGDCVAKADDCAGSDECEHHGLCAPSGGRCVAASDASCEASIACTTRGECGARDGRCVVTEEGCRQTSLCREEGWCSVVADRCRALSGGDCSLAKACSAERRCEARGWRCVE